MRSNDRKHNINNGVKEECLELTSLDISLNTMEDPAFSKQMIEKRNLFPWLKIFLDKIVKKFPNDIDKDILQFLLQNFEKEVNSFSNEEDTSRKEALFEVIFDLFLHFWWRVRWDGKKKWRKCWKKAYTNVTYSYDQRTKCLEELLYFIIYLGIILSNGRSESEWAEKILKALNILPSFDDIICNSLLRINNLEEKYHHVYMAVLKHVLCSEVAQNVSEPTTYIKITLLLRRLKNYTKDKVTLSSIEEKTVSMKAPPDTSDWLSSLEVNLKVKKHKSIAGALLGKKFPETIIHQLHQIVTGRENPETKNDSYFNKSEEMSNQRKVSDYEHIQPNPHLSREPTIKEPTISRHMKHTQATNTPSSSNPKIKIRLNHKMLGGFNTTPNSADLKKTVSPKKKEKSKSSSNLEDFNEVTPISKARKVNDFLRLSFDEISNFSENPNVDFIELDCTEEVKDINNDFVNQDSESNLNESIVSPSKYKKKHVEFHSNSIGRRMKLPSKSLEDTKLSAKGTFIDNCEITKFDESAYLVSPENSTPKIQKNIQSKLIQPMDVESSSASKLSLSLSVEKDTNCKTPQSDEGRFYFELSDSNPTTLNESSYFLQDPTHSTQHCDVPLQAPNKSTDIDFKLINSAIAGNNASSQNYPTENRSKTVGISSEKLSNIESSLQKLRNGLVCSPQLNKNNLIRCNKGSVQKQLFSQANKNLSLNKHHLTDTINQSPKRSKKLLEDKVVTKNADESICIMQDENASHCLVDCKIVNDSDSNNSLNKEGQPSIKVFINVTCKSHKDDCNLQKEHIFGTFNNTSLQNVTSTCSVNYFNAPNPFSSEKSDSKMPSLTPYFNDLPLLTSSLGTPPDSELDMSSGGSIKNGNTEATTKFVTKEFLNTQACSTPKNTAITLSGNILADHSDFKTPNTSECESSNEWSLENTNLTNSLLLINSLQNSSADDVLKKLNSRTSFVASKADTESSTLHRQRNPSVSYRSIDEIYSEAEFSDDSTISCPSHISGSDPELNSTLTIKQKSRKGSKGIPKKKTKVLLNKRKKPCAKKFKSEDLQEKSSCIAAKRYNLRSRGDLSKPSRLGDFIT
ncbi:hypothetical protein JTE90_001567 [Oedothorax gibbosus]|uniref:Uncharacterized protein n=1 Tax=Oedothorax gibbosus TaxID=931172 RepID=A0AAV6VLG0_9ARAC|nr:hypothetical protein JTE90_001567 [Oedothorax gibbosus]